MDKEHVMILKVLGAKTSKTEKMRYCMLYIALNKGRVLKHFFAKNCHLWHKKNVQKIVLQILYDSKGLL